MSAPTAAPAANTANNGSNPSRLRQMIFGRGDLFAAIRNTVVFALIGFLLIFAGYRGWLKPGIWTVVIVLMAVLAWQLIAARYRLSGGIIAVVTLVAVTLAKLAGALHWGPPSFAGSGPLEVALAILIVIGGLIAASFAVVAIIKYAKK